MSFDLETLHVSGTPTQMGRAQGETWRERIVSFMEMRFDAVSGYVAERGGIDWERIYDVGSESFALFEAWDPTGAAEQRGIAEGARVDPIRLFTAANMTDMRDAVLLSAPSGPPLRKRIDEGCSSLMVPGARTAKGLPLAGQTWDLNPPDVDYVVAVRRSPTDGPQTWTVTCTGCLTLMGISERGLSVGTTNIKTYGARTGVGYMSILHRALRADDAKDAQGIIDAAPHAGAHTYWVADGELQLEWEASPVERTLRVIDQLPLYRTNHCIGEGHRSREGEVVGDSSRARFARLEVLLAGNHHTPESLRKVFADRAEGVLSINRYAEDEQGTATNAVFIASPSERRAWACRGPADRGVWTELTFD